MNTSDAYQLSENARLAISLLAAVAVGGAQIAVAFIVAERSRQARMHNDTMHARLDAQRRRRKLWTLARNNIPSILLLVSAFVLDPSTLNAWEIAALVAGGSLLSGVTVYTLLRPEIAEASRNADDLAELMADEIHEIQTALAAFDVVDRATPEPSAKGASRRPKRKASASPPGAL